MLSIIVIPDLTSAQSKSDAKGKLFEEFVKDVVFKHSLDVERVAFVPKDADVWAYEIVSKTPVMVECKATEKPVTKESVASFFGDYKLQHGNNNRTVGILLSINGYTTQGADSARAYYDRIIKAGESGFHLYGPEDMLRILADHGKVIEVAMLENIVSRAVGTKPEDIYFLITPKGPFWLVTFELEGGDCALLLDAHGHLATDKLSDYIERSAMDVPRELFANLANDRFRSTILDRPRSSAPPAGIGRNQRLAEAIAKDPSLEVLVAKTVDAGSKRALTRLPASASSLATDQWALTIFDALASYLTLDQMTTGLPVSPPAAGAVIVCSVRLAALYASATMLDRHSRGTLGTPTQYAESIIATLKLPPDWVKSIPLLVESISKQVAEIPIIDRVGQPDQDTTTGLASIAALSIHLAAALGPTCLLYRSTLFSGEDADGPFEDLPEIVELHHVGLDPENQTLHVRLTARTPHSRRQLEENIGLVQRLVEVVEDVVDHFGLRLPATRVRPTIDTPGVEILDCYFELDPNQILKILMGEELYGNKEVWVRELLQNAIDATLLRETLVDDYKPLITVTLNRDAGIVQISDNGIGMSLHQVRKFFSKIGRSYYRSAELADHLRNQGKTFVPISRFGLGFLSVVGYPLDSGDPKM